MSNYEQLATSLFNIGKQMCDEGCLCTKVDESLTTMTFIVDRRERTDEEIDTVMRRFKVMLLYAYNTSTGGSLNVKFKYKVAKDYDEWNKALNESNVFADNYINSFKK